MSKIETTSKKLLLPVNKNAGIKPPSEAIVPKSIAKSKIKSMKNRNAENNSCKYKKGRGCASSKQSQGSGKNLN